MTIRDAFGLTLSGVAPAGLSRYQTALHQLQCYNGDPVATVDAAITMVFQAGRSVAVLFTQKLLGAKKF